MGGRWFDSTLAYHRRVAQLGSALALGSRGRRFESYLSDQNNAMNIKIKVQRDSCPEEEWNYEDVVWSGVNNEDIEERMWLMLRSLTEQKTFHIPMAWIKNIQIVP